MKRNTLVALMVLVPVLLSLFVCVATDYDACLVTCELSDNYGNCAAECCIKWPVQCEEAQ